MLNRNRIVTPDSDPDRWSEEEAGLFRKGRCSWQTGYGLPGVEYCGQPSRPGASFGHCEEHEAELLESHYNDGTPR